MSKWQPIETAPKDGTLVLVGRFDHKGAKEYPNNIVMVDFWHTRPSYTYDGFGHFNEKYWPATHWQPLPPTTGE